MPTRPYFPESASGYPCRLHRYPNARIDEWAEAGTVRSGPWPRIKIVATSGSVIVGDDDLPDRSLRKPYRGTEVVATLREMSAA
jgi:hypothetical protein